MSKGLLTAVLRQGTLAGWLRTAYSGKSMCTTYLLPCSSSACGVTDAPSSGSRQGWWRRRITAISRRACARPSLVTANTCAGYESPGRSGFKSRAHLEYYFHTVSGNIL